MATTQAQVDQASADLKVVKRNKDGSANRNALWNLAKRYKAYPNFSDFEDTPFSHAIWKSVTDIAFAPKQ